MSTTVTRSKSNGWNASINFSAKAVSGGVGFNVTYSESYSFSVTYTNTSAGANKQIRFKDGHYVKRGDVKTDWYMYHEYSGMQYWYTTYGTSWGARFDNRTYYMVTI